MAQGHLHVYLLVFATFQWLDGSLTGANRCGVDEYYDGVVGQCGPCKEVCKVCNGHTFCVVNCAEYHARLCSGLLDEDNKKTSTSHPVSHNPVRPGPPEAINPPVRNPPSVMTNPLLWLSICCLMVALLATAIVIFVICHYAKSHRYTDPPLLQDDKPGYSRSPSEESSTTCSHCQQDKKCIVKMNSQDSNRVVAALLVPDLQKSHQAIPENV